MVVITKELCEDSAVLILIYNMKNDMKLVLNPTDIKFSLMMISNVFRYRLYGFKIHPTAYQLQYQAAQTYKQPLRSLNAPSYSPAKVCQH
uniref:Uncharacterized protein n=1 Tax=Romanomermis culicivorax TaxID=13658 RepID=A0A915LAT9_ROMCU